MCYYDTVVYKDCGHRASESVTPCIHGCDAINQRCMVSIWENRVADPGKKTYCRSCYCKIESEICKAADQMLRDIKEETLVVLEFQTESEGKHQESLIKYRDDPDMLEVATSHYMKTFEDIRLWIAEIEEDKQEARKWMARELKAFRESQGV